MIKQEYIVIEKRKEKWKWEVSERKEDDIEVGVRIESVESGERWLIEIYH